jgi:hypothetical protein
MTQWNIEVLTLSPTQKMMDDMTHFCIKPLLIHTHVRWVGCQADWSIDSGFLTSLKDGLSTRLANLLNNGFLASPASLYRMG